MNIPLLKNTQDLKNKRVLLRVDFNVPIEGDTIEDDFRIRRILPTLAFLKGKEAQIILLSHHSDATQTLELVARHLNDFIKTSFVSDIFNTHAYSQRDTVYLCENLRFHKGEENNDEDFAKKLASLGDIYVNDAFSVSHRKHASIVALPQLLPHYAGLLFEDEVKYLSEAFEPPQPSLLILGGMKADTKLPLAKKFLDIADNIFIGGAVVHTVWKQAGYEIGRSTVEEVDENYQHLLEHENVIMPRDVIIEKEGKVSIKKLEDVLEDEKILDAGPETVKELSGLIKKSAFVFWNGSLGYFEHGFEKSTVDLINIFAESKTKTVVGGGDTVAAISRFGKEEYFDFVSTGGGAMLEFLANKTLPGIDALKK
ncbi:phosphoglycerate kinase [bacterium]|nr:phosphoglycerate kinase [bacterium]|tara:strand:+ start:2159 stop:3265 length:1107 start_codon:yes stop_codon:yes gene_type:complete